MTLVALAFCCAAGAVCRTDFWPPSARRRWVHMAFCAGGADFDRRIPCIGTLMSVGIMILQGAALRYWTRSGPHLLGPVLAACLRTQWPAFSYHLGCPPPDHL
jgi:hypothetical protein